MSGTPRENGVRQCLSALRAPAVTKFAPLAGLLSGALAGAAYWLGTQLSMAAGMLLTDGLRLTAAAHGVDAPLSHLDLGLALLLGCLPALLLGVPGLRGLAAAVASMLGLSAAPRSARRFAPWVAETCVYLGAQASWSYA